MPRKSRNRALSALAAVAAAISCALVAGGVQAAPKNPGPSTPRADASVDAVPAFGWKAARRAAKYEFQLSADPGFESIVLGEGRGSFQTRNTFATIDKTLPNGNYFWRVRKINANENAGKWSDTRKLIKRWDEAPALLEPANGQAISYPLQPLVLRWSAVPGAYKYHLWIGTDPTLASVDKPIETSATVYSPPQALGPGRYYWAVTPVDAQKHLGTRSAVGSFVWRWPSQTRTALIDLNSSARVMDPQFAWQPVPGAARYEVEVNPSRDFAVGSRVCCDEKVIGTSLSPKKVLPNNAYYWRVRAVDMDGQAGVWNYGTPFRKAFDAVNPSIPNLRVRDNLGNPPSGLNTSYPIVRWDPVPGASSYRVQVAPHQGFCNWTVRRQEMWNVETAATAWTPLANGWNGQSPGVPASQVALDAGKIGFQHDEEYCVRVQARSDRDSRGSEVTSEWTQINGLGQVAFNYIKPATASDPTPTMLPQYYVGPPNGVLTTRLPLFTWKPVPGAASYYVVVARDPSFTQVVDIALTHNPMYAPRKSQGSQSYPDETTSYYWAVVPATGSRGEGVGAHPMDTYPRRFEKRSSPPRLLTPANGQNITRQPMFRWTATESAREYQIQVATDPSFSSLVDNVTTAATSFTSEGTYPADTVLYWRVRANDENKVGLTWSAAGTFRRKLPIPQLAADNPRGGETIPVLRWHPVEGATSYDLHIEQSDGTRRDFDLRGTAATFVIWYGTGVWRWQVRANFPTATPREVQGGYTPLQPFARRIATPGNLRAINKDRHMLLQWNPAPMARNYRAEISTTDSFTRVIDRVETDNASWAPKLLQPEFLAGGTFYWRVAALDEGRNVGGWRVAKVRTRRGFVVSISGFPRKRTMSLMRVQVTNGRGKGVRKAKVIVSGSKTKRRSRRTGRDGSTTLKVKPKKAGRLKFRVKKRGYRAATQMVDVIG
jgi:hypothetical protein